MVCLLLISSLCVEIVFLFGVGLRLYLGPLRVSLSGIRWNANGVWYVATFGSFQVRNLINLSATSNDKVGVTRA